MWSTEGMPKRGEVAFVNYWYEATPPLEGVVKARGSPFKSTILKIEYEPEGIMYTVQHHTDLFVHKAHISDFRAMADGSYPRMKGIVQADARAHAAWLQVWDA